jgi:putative membrane protein
MEHNAPLDEHFTGFPVVALAKRLAFWLAVVAVYCAAVGAVVHFNHLKLHALGTEGGLLNSLIVGLLLGFRNRAAYDRWWEARRLWGQLTNDIRNLACQLAAFLPAEVILGSPLAMLLIAYPKALKRHLRGESPRWGEISGFEQPHEPPPHLPVYLAGRIYRLASDWEQEGRLDQAKLLTLAPHLRGLLDVCGGCERIRNTPLSPWYKGLLRTGIALNIIITPWYTMGELGAWGLPILLLMSFFFLGVEVVDTIVEEPFGRERDDLDLDRYCDAIEQSVAMLLPRETRSAVAMET